MLFLRCRGVSVRPFLALTNHFFVLCRWGDLAGRVPIQKKLMKQIRRTRDGWASPLAGGLSNVPQAIAENVESAMSHIQIPSHSHRHTRHSDDAVVEFPELMEHRIADHSVDEKDFVSDDITRMDDDVDHDDGLHGGLPSGRGDSLSPPDQPSSRGTKQVSFRLGENPGAADTALQQPGQPMLGSLAENREPHDVQHGFKTVAAVPAMGPHASSRETQ